MYSESLTSRKVTDTVTAIHTTDVTVMGQSNRRLGNVRDDRGSNRLRIFCGGGGGGSSRPVWHWNFLSLLSIECGRSFTLITLSCVLTLR